MGVGEKEAVPEDGQLAPLLDALLSRDVRAWQRFQLIVVPRLERWTRQHRSLRRRGLASSPDDQREVVTATLERIHADAFRCLRKFVAAHPDLSEAALDAWLYQSFDYVVREHLRARYGRLPRRSDPSSEPAPFGPSKRDLQTLAPRIASELKLDPAPAGITARVTANEILRYIEQTFSSDEISALHGYFVEDETHDQLAVRLALPTRLDAERLVRRLKERLRVQFQLQHV